MKRLRIFFKTMSIPDRITWIVIGCISLPVFSLVAAYLGGIAAQLDSMQKEHQASFLKSVNVSVQNECRQVTEAMSYLKGMEVIQKFVSTDFIRNSDHILNLTYDVSGAISVVAGVNDGLIAQITFYSANPTLPEHGNIIHNISWLEQNEQLSQFMDSEETCGFFFDIGDNIYLSFGARQGNSAVYAEKVMNVQGSLYGIFVMRLKEERLLNALSLADPLFPIQIQRERPDEKAAVYNDFLGLYLCQETDQKEVHDGVVRTTLITLSFTVLGLFLIVILMRGIFKLVFRNMYNMIDAMEYAAHGNFNVRIPVGDAKDIRRITVQFNALLDELNEYIGQKLLLEEKNRKAQAAALQLQMNPHFFYNGLGMLQCVMEDCGQYDISNAISWLSAILRYNMTSCITSTLSEEIRCVTCYINFVNTFRDKKVDFIVEAPEESEDSVFPRFLLQPLAENAVKYGDGGYVRFHIEEAGDSIRILAANSGKKLEAERLHQINDSLNNSSIQENSGAGKIGLRNIAARLRLLYGENCGMTLSWNGEFRVSIEIKKIPAFSREGCQRC